MTEEEQPQNGRLSTHPLTPPGDRDEDEQDYTGRAYQCGLGSWRPSWLQRCANVKFFTATLAFWSLFGNMNFTYYTASITQIERDFGLSSSMTGFIKNVDNIGYMLTVVIFSHFFRYSNKPRLFFAATLVSSSAIFLFATPHFFFGSGREEDVSTMVTVDDSNTTTRDGSESDFCYSQSDSSGACSKRGGIVRAFNAGALGLFILSELIQGIGQSPKFTLGMTYLDDNAKKDSPKYFAYMFSMRAFSPVMGFLLGAWTSSIYVDLSDPGFGPRDPRWVGAWWLGFVICAAVSIIWALPLLLFPAKFKPRPGEKAAEEKVLSPKELMKDLPLAMARLIKNKVYITIILAICVKIYMVGFMTFLPKYLELQFGVTASVASILTGVLGASAWAIGPIVSGIILAKFKDLNPFKAMKMLCVVMALTTAGFFIMFFLGCPADKWAGDVKGHNHTLECNQDCSCDSVRYQPICGDDNLNYYSPCHAGCTGEYRDNSSNLAFTGCKCIPGGHAVSGYCPKNCHMIIPYSIMLFITKFVASMSVIPTMSILMRCVEYKDKATSLAIATAIMQVVSFPAPIVGGLVIDSACVIQQQSSCSSRKGACLFYDSDDFRFRLQGFVFIINLLSFLIYLLGLWFSRNAKFSDSPQEKDNDKENEKDKELITPMLDPSLPPEKTETKNTSDV